MALAARPSTPGSAPKRLAALDEVDPGWRSEFAKRLKLGRTSYYVEPTKQAARDSEAVVAKLRVAHELHPFYGVDRFAFHLGWNKKKTGRIRNLAGVVVPTPTKKRRHRAGAPEISAPPNILGRYAKLRNELRPQDGMDYRDMVNTHAWAQDFTYLWFEKHWHYLAVVLDLKTRQVVGWRLGTRHTSELTYEALLDALSKHHSPAI